MKSFATCIMTGVCSEPACETIETVSRLIDQYPMLLVPVRGMDKGSEVLVAGNNLVLYSTVRTTTLLYDPHTDCFLKILHPVSLKSKALFMIKNRARQIWRYAEELNAKGIPVPAVLAYGQIRKGNRPFFAMKKIAGRSLYDMLIIEKKILPFDLSRAVIDRIAALHRAGYWFGDAHLAHIFTDGYAVSGFIDIDSIRKNRGTGIKNFAKDLAGLNHPRLPMTKDEKRELLHRYLQNMKIQEEDEFLKVVKHYTERRWKASAASRKG